MQRHPFLRSIIPTPRSIIVRAQKSPHSSWKTLLPRSSSLPLHPPTRILSIRIGGGRNCERRAGSPKKEEEEADKTVVIKERGREIFPRQGNDIYADASSIRENPPVSLLLAKAEGDQGGRHEKKWSRDLEERDDARPCGDERGEGGRREKARGERGS